jgi:hypothetical protein
MKTLGGDWKNSSILNLALCGGEWPGERAPGTHWMGGWVGPRVGLDAAEKRKILHCRKPKAGRPACSLLQYRLSYPDSFRWFRNFHNPSYQLRHLLFCQGIVFSLKELQRFPHILQEQRAGAKWNKTAASPFCFVWLGYLEIWVNKTHLHSNGSCTTKHFHVVHFKRWILMPTLNSLDYFVPCIEGRSQSASFSSELIGCCIFYSHSHTVAPDSPSSYQMELRFRVV